MCHFVPTLHKLRLNRLWAILIYFLPEDKRFKKSVYGPELIKSDTDHQYTLCVSGKSGFKLSDILKQTKEPMDFLDIGSNFGLYSLIAAENLFFKEIFSIEPNPEVIQNYKLNKTKNGAKRLSLIEGAVSNTKNSVVLNFGDQHLGMGSIIRKNQKSILVRSITKSDLNEIGKKVKNPLFIKITAEGAEALVLAELFKSDLVKQIKSIFIEITPKWLSVEDYEKIHQTMNLFGFELQWKSKGKEQYDALFVKKKICEQIDKKVKDGCRLDRENTPKYSICVPVYNMADTLERAITSVANQLNNDYEILIIDDGSNDGSVSVIQKLERQFVNVRSIFLSRDPQRKLGETRNLSIYAARGEYVLLHIDADDVWEPYIQDLVFLFHKLEQGYGKDFFLVGQQTGIAKRELLLKLGGYENVYRGEDRSLMLKLALVDKILFMDYESFMRRLERPFSVKIEKGIWDMWSHLEYDLLRTERRWEYIFVGLFMSYDQSVFSLKARVLRSFLILPAFLFTLFKNKRRAALNWDDFMTYRRSRRGTFEELMSARGIEVSLEDYFENKALRIFRKKSTNEGFKSG